MLSQEARHSTPFFGSLREPIRKVTQKGVVLLAGFATTLATVSIPSDNNYNLAPSAPLFQDTNPYDSIPGLQLEGSAPQIKIVCYEKGEAGSRFAPVSPSDILFIARGGDYVYVPPGSGLPDGGWFTVMEAETLSKDVNPSDVYVEGIPGPDGQPEFLVTARNPDGSKFSASPALANVPCSVPNPAAQP